MGEANLQTDREVSLALLPKLLPMLELRSGSILAKFCLSVLPNLGKSEKKGEKVMDKLKVLSMIAEDMKKERYSDKYAVVLKNRSFLMFFYNPSVRTRQSFEIAATELGGHALFLEPKSMRLKTATSAGETVEDAANVMSRYGVGLGIRILEAKISNYGEGDDLIREYAKYSDIPIISMAHDKYHPCQGLADIQGYRAHLGKDLKNKTIVHVWGHGALGRSHCSVQESMLICSKMGMNVRVAHPKGYDLDPQVIEWSK